MTLPNVRRSFLLILACASVATSVAGDEGHHQEAHVHGAARLQVAIEGRHAELILRSPAANLVGFEHQPRNAEQEATVAQASEWLGVNPLVQNARQDCVVTEASVHHQQGGKEGHGHDKHPEHDQASGHSDFEVTQRIECDSELSDPLTTPLTTRFASIESLSVEWLSPNGQGHSELHSGETKIPLDH